VTVRWGWAAIAAVALLLATAGAADAAGPLPPLNVSAPAPTGSAPCEALFVHNGVGGVDVAANARGDTIVSWTRNAGGGTQMVQAAFRPAGGSFGPPQDIGLTEPCYLFAIGGATPDVALDAQGGAVIVFPAIADSGEGVVRSALKPPGGAFAGPVDLATGVPTLDDIPRVTMNAAGTAVAVWSRRIGANTIVQSSTRSPGGAFGPAINLSAAGANAKTPRVALNDAGATAIAWVRRDATVDRAQARLRPAGQGAFAAVQDLSTTGTAGQDASTPDVALDPRGVATVVWSREIAGNTLIQSRFLNAAGVIAAGIDDVSGPADLSVAPNLAVDPSGTAVTVFRACPKAGGDCAVKAATRPGGGSFGDVETISPPTDQNVFPKVVMDPAGTATAAFTPFITDVQTLLTRRPAGGRFGAVQAVSPAGGTSLMAALAADDEGNVLVGWSFLAASGGSPWAAQVSAFDAAPPTLSGVTVPTTSTAGTGVRMTAATSDRWSSSAVSWDFGDGVTASGDAVTHTFGSPGAFGVGVTATDAAGNASSETHSVLATAAPRPRRKVIRSKVRATWGVNGKRIFLLRLRVTGVPKGGKVELRCARSPKCPFDRKSSKRRRAGAITLFDEIKPSKAVGKKLRTFRAGQRLQVRVTAKGFVGKAVRYELEKGKIPAGRGFCTRPGGKKLRKRC
jgi:hypothetical protein